MRYEFLNSIADDAFGVGGTALLEPSVATGVIRSRWTFDIRDTVPGYPMAANASCDGDTPEVEACYEQINAMCFLLHDISFSVVYGPVGPFCRLLLQKLDEFDPRDVNRLLGCAVIGALRTHLAAIETSQGADTIQLRWFYENIAEHENEEEWGILERFLQIAGLSVTTGRPLCMPFVRIQKRKTTIDRLRMGDHIRRIGDYTFFEIYTKSKLHHVDLRKAVEHARLIGAFRDRQEEVMVLPPLNNRKCAPSGCITNNGTWCNVDAQGNCTSGSN